MIENDGMLNNGNICWFVGRKDGILYKYLIDKKMVIAVKRLETTKESRYRLFDKYICVKNKLYILPNKDENIVIYDLINEDITYLSVPEAKGKRVGTIGVWEIKGNIYFVSAELLSIYCINVDAYVVQMEHSIRGGKKEHLTWNCALYNNKIYLIYDNVPKITTYDIEIKEQKEIYLNNISSIGTIIVLGGVAFVTSCDNSIYAWNMLGKEVTLIAKVDENFIRSKKCQMNQALSDFSNSVQYEDYIVFLPRNIADKYFGGIVCYDVITKRLILIELPFCEENLERIFKFEYWNEKLLVLCDYTGKHMLKIDIDSGNIEWIYTTIDATSYYTVCCPERICTETNITLEDYLKINTLPKKQLWNRDSIKIGTRIYQAVQ